MAVRGTGSTGLYWFPLGTLGNRVRHWFGTGWHRVELGALVWHWFPLRTLGGSVGSTGLYWEHWFVLGALVCTGLYWEHWFLPVLTGLHWCTLVHTGVSRSILVLTGSYWCEQRHTGSQWFILVCTGSFVLEHTGFYLHPLAPPGSHWFILVLRGSYWFLLVHTGPHGSILVHTGLWTPLPPAPSGPRCFLGRCTAARGALYWVRLG